MLAIIKRNLGNSPDSSLKTLRTAMGLIIERLFLSKITWTGKTINGGRKVTFSGYTHIFELLFGIVSDLHVEMTESKLKKGLVGNIFRHAYA